MSDFHLLTSAPIFTLPPIRVLVPVHFHRKTRPPAPSAPTRQTPPPTHAIFHPLPRNPSPENPHETLLLPRRLLDGPAYRRHRARHQNRPRQGRHPQQENRRRRRLLQ